MLLFVKVELKFSSMRVIFIFIFLFFLMANRICDAQPGLEPSHDEAHVAEK